MDGKQEYVLIRNTQLVTTSFSDHQGVIRKLAPISRRGDTVKILIMESDVEAIHKYNGLAKQSGFLVEYSPGFAAIAESMQPTQKLFIEAGSSANPDVQRRIDALRNETETTGRQERLTQVRLRRAQVAAKIKAGGAAETEALSEEVMPPDEPIAAPVAPAPAAPATEMDQAVRGLGAEIPLTQENLAGMAKVDLVEIASGLKITVRPGISKNGLINQIIAATGKGA